jgi:hypothetical protein
LARVNIKTDETTRDRLQSLKRDSETWDDLLNRLAEYGELVEQN